MDVQNIGLVLVLATLTAAMNVVVCAGIAMVLRDRERSQFLYALFILVAGTVGYLFDFAPIPLISRLASGAYYAGLLDVAKYGVVLLLLLLVFFRSTRRLAMS